MAHFNVFECKKCGYQVVTEPQGFYALMSGQYYNFKCKGCKNIVSISAKNLAAMEFSPTCPECGDSEHLSTWNPIEGKCPRCGGRMKKTDIGICAD